MWTIKPITRGLFPRTPFLLAFIIGCCWPDGPGRAQSGLNRQAANVKATSELSGAIAAHKLFAEKEWGKGKNEIVYGDYRMKFDYRIFGTKPANGRSLYISLHGGGNAPAEVNDQQWGNQHFLYAPAEGVYLVPRAPSNTWNLWHEDHIDAMLGELIKDAIVMEDVDPNRIYLMGYSAGGDGVFQLAPRMADHWAAAAMMAGHPNDACALNLRNLPFAIFMGGADSAYDRNKHAQEWKARLDSLRQTDPAGYIHEVHIYPGLPHWMNRNDTIAVPWMAGFVRNALPRKLAWVQDDRHHTDFYWLGTDSASIKTGDTVIASIADNTVAIEHNDYETLYVYLNDNMLDLDKPVTVTSLGKKIFKGKLKRNGTIIRETAAKRLDADLIFSARIVLKNGRVNND